MDLNGKKTVLSDESTIYKQKEELSEKEKIKQMTWLERLDYFRTYYLVKVIVVLISVCVFGSILYTALSPKPDRVISVAVIDSAIHLEKTIELQEKFEAFMELDEKTQETWFEDYDFEYEQKKALQKFVLYNASGDLDITIMPQSVFEKFAPLGHFAEITESLPTDLYMELSDYLVECKQEGDDGNLIEGSETVYGICLDSLWVLEGQKLEESVILGIGVSTVNEENIESFIRFLFSSEQSK